jgi:hypothetical protein
MEVIMKKTFIKTFAITLLGAAVTISPAMADTLTEIAPKKSGYIRISKNPSTQVSQLRKELKQIKKRTNKANKKAHKNDIRLSKANPEMFAALQTMTEKLTQPKKKIDIKLVVTNDIRSQIDGIYADVKAKTIFIHEAIALQKEFSVIGMCKAVESLLPTSFHSTNTNTEITLEQKVILTDEAIQTLVALNLSYILNKDTTRFESVTTLLQKVLFEGLSTDGRFIKREVIGSVAEILQNGLDAAKRAVKLASDTNMEDAIDSLAIANETLLKNIEEKEEKWLKVDGLNTIAQTIQVQLKEGSLDIDSLLGSVMQGVKALFSVAFIAFG